MLAVAALTGMAAGMMDAGLNTAVALTGRARLVNLLHGAYGVGTAIGPLVVTIAILTGSWRPAYLMQLTLDLVAVLWLRHRQRDRARPEEPEVAQDRRERAAPGRDVVPAPLQRGGSGGHERVLRLFRPGSRRRAVGGELLPWPPEPVDGRDRPGRFGYGGR